TSNQKRAAASSRIARCAATHGGSACDTTAANRISKFRAPMDPNEPSPAVSASGVKRSSYDAIVVGGGLGGLLASLAMLRAGRSVLLLERLPYLGGRFSTIEHDGCQISTGALHLAPHGDRGPLGALLQQLDLPMLPPTPDVVASFHHA